MYFFAFQFFLLGCIFQLFDAAPPNAGNLPFEVDMDSGNTGIDTAGLDNGENGLTAQASKQGENFVASPKPADISEGFSFNSEPETTTPKINDKPPKPASTAASANSSQKRPISIADPLSTSDPTIAGSKKKHKPNSEVSTASSSPPFANPLAMLQDPFFAYALQDFLRQQQLLMSLLSSDLMGMGMGGPSNQLGAMKPMFPFGGALQMPTIADMQETLNPENMDLVEDRVVDNGKGRVQTFKSKNGNAVIQTVTYGELNDDGSSPTLPAEPTIAVPAVKSHRPKSARLSSSTKALSPRRVKAH